MSKYVDYSRLRTIKDVRVQRRKIDKRLDRTSEYLSDDLACVKELFTLDYWLDMFGEKLGAFNSTVKAAYSGVRLIMSLLKR